MYCCYFNLVNVHIYPPVIIFSSFFSICFECAIIFSYQDLISMWLMSRSTMQRAKQFALLFTFNLMSHVAFFLKDTLGKLFRSY